MSVRALILTAFALGAVSVSGCLALGPLATVVTLEKVEQATGVHLDPSPDPAAIDNAQSPRLDAVPSGAPGSPYSSTVPLQPGQSPGATNGASPGAAASPGTGGTDPRLANLITLGMFNQVQPGMSLADVEKITGHPGQLIPNARLETYVWYNPNGSSLRVIMAAKRVTQKFQERLS
jgi:hypothetical protein